MSEFHTENRSHSPWAYVHLVTIGAPHTYKPALSHPRMGSTSILLYPTLQYGCLTPGGLLNQMSTGNGGQLGIIVVLGSANGQPTGLTQSI
jgi:hypothetical protein